MILCALNQVFGPDFQGSELRPGSKSRKDINIVKQHFFETVSDDINAVFSIGGWITMNQC